MLMKQSQGFIFKAVMSLASYCLRVWTPKLKPAYLWDAFWLMLCSTLTNGLAGPSLQERNVGDKSLTGMTRSTVFTAPRQTPPSVRHQSARRERRREARRKAKRRRLRRSPRE